MVRIIFFHFNFKLLRRLIAFSASQTLLCRDLILTESSERVSTPFQEWRTVDARSFITVKFEIGHRARRVFLRHIDPYKNRAACACTLPCRLGRNEFVAVECAEHNRTHEQRHNRVQRYVFIAPRMRVRARPCAGKKRTPICDEGVAPFNEIRKDTGFVPFARCVAPRDLHPVIRAATAVNPPRPHDEFVKKSSATKPAERNRKCGSGVCEYISSRETRVKQDASREDVVSFLALN